MTDYLTRLAAQNQNLKRGIRPRLPMRFELPSRTGPVQPGDIFANAAAGNKELNKSHAPDEPFPEDTGIESLDKPAGIYQIPGSIARNRQRNRVTIDTGTLRTVSLHSGQPEKNPVENNVPAKSFVKKKHVSSDIVEAGKTDNSYEERAVQKKFRPFSEKSDNTRYRSPQEKKIKTGNYASPDQDPKHYPEETENTRITGIRASSRHRGHLPGVPGTEHPDTSAVPAETKKNISSERPSGQDRDPEYIPVETENTRTTGSRVSPRDRGRLPGALEPENPDTTAVPAGTRKNLSSLKPSSQEQDPEYLPGDTENTRTTGTRASSRHRGHLPGALEPENPDTTAVPAGTRKNSSSQIPSSQEQDPGRSSDNREKTRLSEKNIGYQNRNPAIGTVRHESVITPEVIRKYSPVKDYTAWKIPEKDTPVQVTIGRIEIHAGSEDNVQKKRRAPPVLGLEDYLSHHSKRGAG